MNLKKWFLVIGIFLVLDGLLSVYFGNSCLNNCANNNNLGNLVRYARAVCGGILIYFNYK